MTPDKISRLHQRKKFYRLLFHGIDNEEYIRLFQNKDDYTNITFWNNIDELNNYVENNRFNANTYFSLATTDGQGGTTENLKYRYFLAWDFDKKIDHNLDAKEIMFRFKALKLWYHAIIDSGNGFHVYMIIEKTDDINQVDEVTKAIGAKLGADPQAMLQTQVLRVPITFNLKDNTKKYVNIIKMYNENIRPYKLADLHKRFCKTEPENSDRTIKYALNKTNFPPCIENMLQGVESGNRHFALMRLISFLKVYRYTQSEAWNIIKEWNNKNDPPFGDNELDYQFNYIWEKQYNCFGCITQDIEIQALIKKYCNFEACKNKSKENVIFIEGETLQMEYKLCKSLEKPKRDMFQLKGNHLLIIGVLKNNHEGIYTNEIIDRLTYKGKCCISPKTFSSVVNDLKNNGYITIIKGNKRKAENDFYKINNIKCEEIEKFNMSYFIVLGVIKENISAEDFKVYCYLRYRLAKGLSVTQDKLADELGVTQQNISLHIQNLLREKYLELKYVDYSGNVFSSNVYKVNY